jgi:hypothetical protein
MATSVPLSYMDLYYSEVNVVRQFVLRFIRQLA